MVHNPNHQKGGHNSRGPDYNNLHSKGEYWNIPQANRRVREKHHYLLLSLLYKKRIRIDHMDRISYIKNLYIHERILQGCFSCRFHGEQYIYYYWMYE